MGVLGPFSLRIDAEVVLPVVDGLGVEEHPFASEGAIKKGDRIIRRFGQRLAQRFNRVAIVDGAVGGFGADEICRAEIRQQRRDPPVLSPGRVAAT